MTKKKSNHTPVFIAHRGLSGRYPENTLLSYQAAYDCGARFMESDIQVTQDKVPVLHHDKSLQRVCGVDIDIDTILAKDLKQYPANYTDKFSDNFSDNRLTTFDEFCQWLGTHPNIVAFIELKQDAIDYCGEVELLDNLYQIVKSHQVASQCIIISFNHSILLTVRQRLSLPIGWVLPSWSTEQQALAEHLEPEFIFCSKRKLPTKDSALWPGNWQWAVYNIDDLDSLEQFKHRSIGYIETNEIDLLLKTTKSNDNDRL